MQKNGGRLYYYGARYYASWIARFVSVDPLQHEYPYYTPYQYAGNMPITYIDLDGKEPWNKNDSKSRFDDGQREYQNKKDRTSPGKAFNKTMQDAVGSKIFSSKNKEELKQNLQEQKRASQQVEKTTEAVNALSKGVAAGGAGMLSVALSPAIASTLPSLGEFSAGKFAFSVFVQGVVADDPKDIDYLGAFVDAMPFNVAGDIIDAGVDVGYDSGEIKLRTVFDDKPISEALVDMAINLTFGAVGKEFDDALLPKVGEDKILQSVIKAFSYPKNMVTEGARTAAKKNIFNNDENKKE